MKNYHKLLSEAISRNQNVDLKEATRLAENLYRSARAFTRGQTMKSVLRSIKPYWFYLICEGKKPIEVGKTAPTAECWDKITYLYCSKDMKSFNLIPKEHREKYRKYLGKVGARFVCDRVIKTCGWRLRGNTGWCAKRTEAEEKFPTSACLTIDEIVEYAGGEGREVSGWHISDLKIYDTPKELGEFKTIKCTNKRGSCSDCKTKPDCIKQITRPPQSWQYIEPLTNNRFKYEELS